MPHEVLSKLKQSKLINSILSIEADAVNDHKRIKIRALLTNNWQFQIWEHTTKGFRRYSYHVFDDKKTIVRWDNSPHYPKLKTFPRHKHLESNIEESAEMDIDSVLNELGKMMEGEDEG